LSPSVFGPGADGRKRLRMAGEHCLHGFTNRDMRKRLKARQDGAVHLCER